MLKRAFGVLLMFVSLSTGCVGEKDAFIHLSIDGDTKSKIISLCQAIVDGRNEAIQVCLNELDGIFGGGVRFFAPCVYKIPYIDRLLLVDGLALGGAAAMATIAALSALKSRRGRWHLICTGTSLSAIVIAAYFYQDYRRNREIGENSLKLAKKVLKVWG